MNKSVGLAIGLAANALLINGCVPTLTAAQIKANAETELASSIERIEGAKAGGCRGEDSWNGDKAPNNLVSCQVIFSNANGGAPTIQEWECPYRPEDLGEGCKLKPQDD